jgi:hypothetical protein
MVTMVAHTFGKMLQMCVLTPSYLTNLPLIE